jgi:hypothetical protein
MVGTTFIIGDGDGSCNSSKDFKCKMAALFNFSLAFNSILLGCLKGKLIIVPKIE